MKKWGHMKKWGQTTISSSDQIIAQQAPRPDRPLPRRRCAPARQRAVGPGLTLAPQDQRLTVQTFEQIKAQIEALPQSEYAKLIDWLSERDAAEWDRAIEQDASSGALDFLIDEAQKEKKLGKLREF
jgi:hypothetical protein